MKSDERVKSDRADEEELHRDRLMALLHNLVRRHGGRSGASRALGIDRRTVAACMDGKGMSWRMKEALERALQDGVGSAAGRQRKRNDVLERRVDALERELREGLQSVTGAVEALREEHAGALRQLELQPSRRKAPRESTGMAGGQDQTGGGLDRASPSAWQRERRYRELVTREPAADDEDVYGEAWPLVEEWRKLWVSHPAGGKGLAWLEAEQRIRELEVDMLERHGLTLPPEKQPLHGLWRGSQLDWRREALGEVRRAVAWRRLVRRVLTLGLWRV